MRFTDNASIESSAMMTDDILAGTDVSEGADKKFTLANLGAWFLENFNGTIGGKSQSVLNAIESKADAAGVSEELTAGTAGQLLSESYEENFEPYKFRKSPYTDRLSESIIGASVVWNQLVNTSDTSVTVPSGHKYLSRISGTDALGESTGTAISVAGTDNVHDLTAMFGTAVADRIYALGADGIKLFRSWYPNDYYPYTEATLEHVSGLEAHEMVGFNQWDEEWEVGGINSNTGVPTTNTDRIRSKNFCPIIPNETYYALNNAFSSGTALYVWFYDADKNFISGIERNSATFVAPANAYYFKISTYGGNYITYNNDICVNLSDPTRNGQYKPYSKHSYALDASLTLRGTLRYDSTKGFYADGDVYEADGTVTRKYGIVDLGTLSWTKNTGEFRSDAFEPRPFAPTSKETAAYWAICSSLSVIPANATGAGVHQGNQGVAINTSGNIWAYVNGFADLSAADFKAAMSGVYMVYALATPTTESAEPYDAIQITDGTEEYVTDCMVPVGHESKYYQNLRSKIEGLPTDFSAIICATEATNTASKNYAVGDYLIYNNTLYKVTTAIATNATLTVGTNITATTIMAEIKALQ
jgi:hypothetical protein